MPDNRRPIKPEVAWPELCVQGRKLRYACEIAQDYVEKARGKRANPAHDEKTKAEASLQAHLDQCESCTDRPAQARARLRAHARSAGRLRPTRERAVLDRVLGASSRFRPVRYAGPERPETAIQVQYAVFKLEGRIIKEVMPNEPLASTLASAPAYKNGALAWR